MNTTSLVSLVLLLGTSQVALAQDPTQPAEDYSSWSLLEPEFESTGGGGIIIRGYRPRVEGGFCRTEFTATDPSGNVYDNSVEFDAVPVQGGILCHEGRWRARDGSASGTTPFRVFMKDRVWRRSP